MKKLFLFLLCAMSALAVNAQTITIQGVLVTEPEPCIGEECMPCLSLAIATTDKTYFINGKCGDAYIATTIDGVEVLLGEGDEVVVTGTVTTGVDFKGDEFYRIEITSIHKREKINWCTQWNVLRTNASLGPDDYPRTYIFVAYGDTTIADKTYAKIGRYWSLSPEKQEYVAAIRQQGDSLLVHYEHADYLLYDFGVKVGDEREIFVGINNWGYTIVPTSTFANKVTAVSVLPDGRKKISVDIYWGDKNSEYYEWDVISSEWIEGVGSVSGLLYTGSFGGLVGGAGHVLLCASNEDGCVYTGEWYERYGCEYNRTDDTALEEVQTKPINAHKVIENGQLVIIRDGVRYNILGAQL